MSFKKGNRKYKTGAEAILSRVSPEPNTGCWLWAGNVNSGGYGTLTTDGINWQAHRLSYISFKDSIPPGFHVDHLCRVRSCVNPSHLEAVTPRTNIIRSGGLAAANSSKTHCLNGHPLDGENLRIHDYGSYGRKRQCRICINTRKRILRKERSDRRRN